MHIPFLLAGPIIRRTERKQVTIWVATSRFAEIEATFYRLDRKQRLKTQTKTKTIKAGKHLYVHLIHVSPRTSTLPTDTLVGYNLFFSDRSTTFDLNSLDLLSPDNPESIVYGDLPYPSFFIQQNQPANILYGSCRKPHGKGKDATTHADNVIRNCYRNPEKRPSALFFMGDQIYADDVADPLFYLISIWANRLVGESDLTAVESRLNTDAIQPDQIHARQYIMESFAAFTSGNAANHLIRFNEYATMYLLAFSPALWSETSIPSFEELLNGNAYHFMYSEKDEKEQRKEEKKHRKRYNSQMNELVSFVKALPQFRRVLANTPTYMIFDDHDITDDWNISAAWQKNVWNAPLGRHTVANGLTAYWLFQGWGNYPEGDTALQAVEAHLQRHGEFGYFSESWVNHMWHMRGWSFVAPTYPQSMFLDTRTVRHFEAAPQPVKIGNIMAETAKAPQLIGPDGWRRINNTLRKSGWESGEPLILVSPTPLYGIGIIESFLLRYVYPLRILGLPIDYTADFEAWKYNGTGFNRFIRQLTDWQPSQCTILSGDVHYANAVLSRISWQQTNQLTIHQFTSSPIHNMSFSGIWGFLMKRMVSINSLKRKRRTIHRCCDYADNLLTEQTKPEQAKWEEAIQYQTSSSGSVIETSNNLGFITLNAKNDNNQLLTSHKEIRFRPGYFRSHSRWTRLQRAWKKLRKWVKRFFSKS
ncbi:hypothetical protein EU245_13055 [Lentibacillus lipolyticus]|nr:hypothetical protein EU245_13055 [Lentibacillus lipolyticus]